MRLRVFVVVVSALTLGFPVAAAGVTGGAVGAQSGSTTQPPDVKAFGDAEFLGATNSFTFNQPIAGIAGSQSSRGYWEAASDGGIFSFGDAHFYGSMGGVPLNEPVVGIAAMPTGKGYWLTAGDGGVFSFGDARFYGPRFNGSLFGETAVGIAARQQGDGYWLVSSTGGVFPFGGARTLGNAEAADISKPVVGIASTHSGAGFWVAGRGTPSTVPAQVTVIRAGHGGGSGEIELQWTGVPGASGYRIERADTASGPFSIAADVNLTTGKVTMVGPGVGNIDSDQQTFYPPSLATPVARVTPRYFTYVEFPVVGYTFRRHYFRVTAYNGRGDGASSVVVCGTPFGDPPC
jgi:hypothetical protein